MKSSNSVHNLKNCIKDAIIEKKYAKPEYLDCGCNYEINDDAIVLYFSDNGSIKNGNIEFNNTYVDGTVKSINVCTKCLRSNKVERA